jgi:hypothetical protein
VFFSCGVDVTESELDLREEGELGEFFSRTSDANVVLLLSREGQANVSIQGRFLGAVTGTSVLGSTIGSVDFSGALAYANMMQRFLPKVFSTDTSFESP